MLGLARIILMAYSQVTTACSRVLSCRRELSVDADDGLRLLNLANACRLDDQLTEALCWAQWSVRPNGWPDGVVDARAAQGLANVLLDLGRFEEAETWFCKADPAFCLAEVQWNRSRVALAQGDLLRAWQLAEGRWLSVSGPSVSRKPSLPAPPFWQGWRESEAVVAWDEQGFGDTLQALRWLPELRRQHPGRVELLVRQPLLRLIQQGLAWLGSGLHVVPWSPQETRLPFSGCHGSLLSLPLPLQSRRWSEGAVLRLPPAPRPPAAPRIGLVWESGRYLDEPGQALEYRRKSLPAAVQQELCRQLQARDLELVLLEPGSNLPASADFLDQAQWIQRCDLLLSVDTAAAHLGGAIGHPTWVLLPWACACRWGRSSVSTPLYASMRLFRQPRHGDWQGLLARLLDALDQWLLERSAAVSSSNRA